MRLMVSGHRLHKLQNYDIEWIKLAIDSEVERLSNQIGLAYSGMASGVDLWFIQSCLQHNIPYHALVPFDDQEKTMNDESAKLRASYLTKAALIRTCKNSWMVESSDIALVVWDGNKGGTHNVVQQLVEKNIPFYWINPVGQKIFQCV